MFFKKEKLSDIRDELQPLIELHHNELQPFDNLVLNPDVDSYIKLEQAEVFHSFTIRDDQNKLVGYSCFYIAPHLQYKDTIQAVQDIIFLHPSLRKRGIGKEFIQFVDKHLKELGAELVFQYVKEGHSFAPLLESLGYKHIDSIYGRRL